MLVTIFIILLIGKALLLQILKSAISSYLDTSTDVSYDGEKLHVSMLPNPSHLEAANPVAVGKARAKQLGLKEGHYGDGSSIMGDEVRQNSLNYSYLLDISFKTRNVVMLKGRRKTCGSCVIDISSFWAFNNFEDLRCYA